MARTHHEGGCLCGALRYRMAGAPLGSMVCHCRTCRRLSAAPVMAWLSCSREQFAFIEGTPAQFSSSLPITRWFCGRCGTHLAYVHADDPDGVEVSTCSLDDPGAFPPTHHSWLEHDVGWLRFGDGLPTFPRSRYG